MIKIKEVLLRIANKDSIKKVASSLAIHRDKIRNFINLAKKNMGLTHICIQKMT
jgi:hypothetical protein